MDEALIQHINEKDYDYITITEICKRAGVNRSTFYLHYETVDAFLKEAIKKMMMILIVICRALVLIEI